MEVSDTEEPNSVDTAEPPNSMEVPDLQPADLRPVGEDVSPVPPSAVLQPSRTVNNSEVGGPHLAVPPTAVLQLQPQTVNNSEVRPPVLQPEEGEDFKPAVKPAVPHNLVLTVSEIFTSSDDDDSSDNDDGSSYHEIKSEVSGRLFV